MTNPPDIKQQWIPTLRRIVDLGLRARPNMIHAKALEARNLTRYHQGGGWTATEAGIEYVAELDRTGC